MLLQLPNGCEFAVALFGLLRAGAIPVMCLPGHRAAELGHFATVSEAKALLIPDTASGFDYRAMARRLVAGASRRCAHVIVDGDPGPFVSWSQVCANRAPAAHTERRRSRVRRHCCWSPAAPPAHPSSSPAPMTTMSTTPPPAPRSAG